MLDGIFMSVLNFYWLVLYEIMTREVRNVKKDQNQKRVRFRLQAKQQQKFSGNFVQLYFSAPSLKNGL